MQTIHANNINDAYAEFKLLADQPQFWRTVSPRGQQTMELLAPLATTYRSPKQRVLFDSVRDANPFFHFFEALWILGGRNDVDFLKQFNSNIANFSDNGFVFHGAYGYRLRNHFYDGTIDQLTTVIEKLRADNDTRQAVLAIWDPVADLSYKGKDTPCNDLIFLKIRDGKLEMRVCCRSNDAVWGAYGANVVQFSTLQEFIAGAVGVEVGPYTQISDSFHVYTEREDWQRIRLSDVEVDPYVAQELEPYSMWTGMLPYKAVPDWDAWLYELDLFLKYAMPDAKLPPNFTFKVPYLQDVAYPMLRAWRCWKSEFGTRDNRIVRACYELEHSCFAPDWTLAGTRWLRRRLTK